MIAIEPVRRHQAYAREGSVLVVGGAGYIGSILCGDLLDAGYEVTVLDPLFYGGSSLHRLVERPGFRLQIGDTRDEAMVRHLLPEVGAVIHLGEIVGDPACKLDPALTLSVNLGSTIRLATLAREAGVDRFLYPSSCSVYGVSEAVVDERSPLNPVSLYAGAKIAAERAILGLADSGFHPTVFRLATLFGLSRRPRFDLVVNTLAGRAVTEGRIVVHGGGQWRPFVHVADVAGLFAQALRLPVARISGQTFNVGSNTQNYTIRDVAELVHEHVPAARLDLANEFDHRNYRVSFDRIADVIGFYPSRSVDVGIAEVVEAVMSGRISDVGDPRYSNVRALVETDARTRAWRTDLADVRPETPFLGRDSEIDANVLLRELVGSAVPVEESAG